MKKLGVHGDGGPRFREIPLRTLIPNLITVLAICAGLTGVRLAFEGRVELAVTMVLVAALLDGVDGRVARRLKAQTKFGAQMDSLADIINFGVAPALVLYAHLLDRVGSFGWIAAVVYAIACGLRLARFNVLSEDVKHTGWKTEFFVGVPAPFGALLVLLPIYLGFIGMPLGKPFAAFSALFTVFVAYLLVSRLPIYSGKSTTRVPGDKVLPVLLGATVFVLLLATYTWETLTISAIVYLAFIPWSIMAYSRRAAQEEQSDTPETPLPM